MKKYIWPIYVLCLVLIWVPSVSAALSEPVTINISEAKPADITGTDRTDDLASFGIPLKDSDGIYDISQLGLTGADVYQFRALGRYPSGNIKWVLVDLITSVNAGQGATVNLTNGSGSSAQSVLASESGNTITVDTGSAVFTIAKSNFNFLDTVTVNGSQIISSGNSKGIVINDGTGEYTSQNDDNSTTILEENGPAKAVIKSTGTMSNGSDNYLYYTARLFFVRNQSYVKAQVTLRNASEAEYQGSGVEAQKPVSEFAVSLRLNTSGEPNYILSRESSEISGSGNGYLYQGYAEKYDAVQNGSDYDRIVGQDGLIINGVTYDDEAALGYAHIENGGNFINAAMPFMGGYWPAGFEIQSDGTIEVATYSQRNSVDANIAWGQHQTREIIFEFNNDTAQKTLYKAQYPLMGHAGIELYRDTGAVFGNTTLITKEEEDAWLTNNGFTSNESNRILPRNIYENSDKMRVERYYYWATTGGFQNDWAEVDLLDWLKTGNGVLLNRAKEAVRFRVDDAWLHSDGFNFKTKFDGDKYAVSGINNNVYFTVFDGGHMFWESTPLMYYLTGNEYIKESLVDMAEWLDWQTSVTGSRAQFRVGAGDLRVYSRQFKALTLLAEFLDDTYYKNIVESMAKQYVVYNSTDTRSTPGRNYDRGYFIGQNRTQVIGDHFVTRVHSDTAYQVWRLLKTDPDVGNDLLVEDLSDTILGWGYFLLNEFIGDNGGSVYQYYVEQPNTYSTTRGGDLNWLYSHSYDLTGNPDFFDKREGGYILATGGRGTLVMGERFFQSFIYRDLNKSNPEKQAPNAGYIDPVGDGQVTLSSGNVTNEGDGRYTLSWTVPAQVSRYQIKFSDQPMVENLGFDQETRQYQYSPDTYDNFWAGFNIQDEPTPGDQGETQTHTIDLQAVMEEFNTYYNLDPSHPRYQTYDGNKTYYFAVKYWTGDPIVESLNAYFTANRTTATLGQSIQFNDTSTGNPSSWHWDFGDGQISDEQHPEHTYQSAGTYTVSLIVDDADTETRVDYITVTTSGPDDSGDSSDDSADNSDTDETSGGSGGSGGSSGCFIHSLGGER